MKIQNNNQVNQVNQTTGSNRTEQPKDTQYQGEKVDSRALGTYEILGRTLVKKHIPIYHDTKNYNPYGIVDESIPLEDRDYSDLSKIFRSHELKKVPTYAEFVNWQSREGCFFYTHTATPVSPDLDFSSARYLLMVSSFYDHTFDNTPTENMPENFDPKRVFELGKNPGLGIREAHANGITGKGVNVAIIDTPVSPSPNIDSNIKSYRLSANGKDSTQMTFHGTSVTSLLAGKETGVAPEANVYYFAQNHNPYEDEPKLDLVESLKSVLELNKSLPNTEKIKVISMSFPVDAESDNPEIKKMAEEVNLLIQELKNNGIWVLSSNEFWNNNFGYLSKKDPTGDPDDFDNYIMGHNGNEETLYVNSGNRTVSSEIENADFRHDNIPCASWAIPTLAGYYALACQVDPSMTPEKFKTIAAETAQIKESPVPSNGIIMDCGFNETMFRIFQENNPNATREDFNNLSNDELEQLRYSAYQVANSRTGEAEIKTLGAQTLMAQGNLDENGEVINRPIKQIKIIDINAMIEKLKSEKDSIK